jgi:hypothetical protein
MEVPIQLHSQTSVRPGAQRRSMACGSNSSRGRDGAEVLVSITGRINQMQGVMDQR